MNHYGYLNKPSLSQSVSPYVKWAIVVILTIGLVFGIRSYVISFEKKENIKTDQIISDLHAKFEETIKKSSKNSNELTIYGQKLLESNQTEWAVIVLNEAVSRDPNYRDASLYAGYAYLKLAESNNNSIELNNLAIDYLKKAGEIDPIYPKTFELLTIAYQNIDDDENSNLCYNKFKEFDK